MMNTNYIPALKYNVLTTVYDVFVSLTLPENKIRNTIAQLAASNNPNSILEYGVGTASNCILLKNQLPDSSIVGIDVDEKILSIAKKKLDKLNHKIPLINYDGNKIPFNDESFDLVLASFVFYHLHPQQKLNAIQEMHRVLKPGGQLIYADWGKPEGLYSKMAFGLLCLVEKPLNTDAHKTGSYHTIIGNAGFTKSRIIKKYHTLFGTLEVAETTKSNKA